MKSHIRPDVRQALEAEPLALYVPALVAALAEQAAVHPATERAVARREGAVAVVPIRGVITNRPGLFELFGFGISTKSISRNITAAVRDPEIKAIVLDIDSPGGTVTGVNELADEIYALRGDKPIIAQIDGMAASAAYWLASSADEIVAGPTSFAGSIGVWTMHQDISKALEQVGVNVTLISAGKYKVEDNPFGPLTDDARAAIQAQVDHFYNLFLSAVARGRGTTASTVRAGYGEGRLLAAEPAKEAGLIDKIRTMAGTLAAYGVDVHQQTPETRRRGARASALRRRLDLLDLSKGLS